MLSLTGREIEQCRVVIKLGSREDTKRHKAVVWFCSTSRVALCKNTDKCKRNFFSLVLQSPVFFFHLPQLPHTPERDPCTVKVQCRNPKVVGLHIRGTLTRMLSIIYLVQYVQCRPFDFVFIVWSVRDRMQINCPIYPRESSGQSFSCHIPGVMSVATSERIYQWRKERDPLHVDPGLEVPSRSLQGDGVHGSKVPQGIDC